MKKRSRKFFYDINSAEVSQIYCYWAVANFSLPEPVEGLCAGYCPELDVPIGSKCSPAMLDPIVLAGDWVYAGSAKCDSRSRRAVYNSSNDHEKWSIFTKGKKWVAVRSDMVTDAKNIHQQS